MRIRAFPDFRHSASLRGGFGTKDPRASSFDEHTLQVDLRECEFVRPPAVLWCVIYPLLAGRRGTDCELWVPENTGVCIYLKSLGLFEILQESGVKVDDLGIPGRKDPQVVLPLTRFDTEYEAQRVADTAAESLAASGFSSANLYPIVTETFGELAQNAVQHSDSPVGAYGLIQFYESQQGRRFVCSVADGGIGIRRSLEKNPELRDRVPYDWTAIELALRERVSGTAVATRGIGLFGVSEDMRQAGRQLIVHSGIGSLHIREDLQTDVRRTKLFSGTLTYASIPA